MPFDGSGNFSRSYSWQDDRDNGLQILASRMDGEFDNFATGMNLVFFRNGLVPMSGNLNMGQNYLIGLGAGTVGALSLRFQDDTTTGLFLDGAGKLGLVSGGTKRVEVNSTGAIITGTLTASGAVTFASMSVTGDTQLTGKLGIATVPAVAFHADGVSIDEVARLESNASPYLSFYQGAATQLGLLQGTTAGIALQASGARVITFHTNSAERMRLDSSGNLGIGTTSPSAPLTVVTSAGAAGISLRGRSADNVSDIALKSNDAVTTYGQIQGRAADLRIVGSNANAITFYTSGTLRATITAAGDLVVAGSVLTLNGNQVATLASPTFTGTPLAPTAAAGTATTQIATTAFVDALRDVAQTIKSAAFQFDLTHRGGHVYYNGAAAAATIPANATVAFPVGTAITIVNRGSGALTLTRAGSVALIWNGADANRTLAVGGMTTIVKTATNDWVIPGGLS